MLIYQPYTYLIGWSYLNKYYYGAEYAAKTKTANPKNLWTTYFTSSAIVEEYRKVYGEPDIVQVRKVFVDADSATKWESKFLRKVNAAKSEIWLNANVAGAFEKCNNKGNTNPRTQSQKEAASRTLRETMSKREHGTFHNRRHSIDSILKMKVPKAKAECPHCGKIGGQSRMKVWHFDNYKMR